MKALIYKFFIFNISLFSFCFYTVEIVNADIFSQDIKITNQINNTGSIVDFSSGIVKEDDFDKTLINKKTFFVVTAYYSPLPNQEHYLRGNYEDEIILNGKGIKGASGKEVFPGMLAAPKTYDFGTKIFLEGLGVGEVSDRGGAIVSTIGSDARGYEYDRIDIWVGSGEDGLKRALAWGKRVIPGYIINDSTFNNDVSISLENFSAPDYVIKNLSNISKIKTIHDEILSKNITPESEAQDIRKLQKLIYDIGLTLKLSQTGDYKDVQEPLINYQLQNKIIARKEDEQAGYFGPITRTKMRSDYISIMEDIKIRNEIEAIRIRAEKVVDNLIEKIGETKLGNKGQNVKYLQASLKLIGKYDKKINGFFNDNLKESIINYQIEKKIILSENDVSAGLFGPKTKFNLKQDIMILVEKKLMKKTNLMVKK